MRGILHRSREPGVTKTSVSSKSRIVQRNGKTERFESQANQEDEK